MLKNRKKNRGENPVWEVFRGMLVIGLMTFYGQGHANAKKISLRDAIEIALRSNITLRQAVNRVNLQRTSVKQSKSEFYPDVSASGRTSLGYNRGGINSFNAPDKRANGSISLDLNSTLNLFRGFHDQANLEQTKLGLRASAQELARARQTAVFETISQFIQAIVNQELIDVDQENLEAQRRQLELVEAYHKQGRRPVADVYQQRAEVAKAELSLLNSKSNFEVSKLLLLQIIGLDPHTKIEIVPLSIDTLITRFGKMARKRSEKDLMAMRADGIAQMRRIEAAKKNIEKSKAGYWPNLSLSLDIGSDYSTLGGQDNGFSEQFFDHNVSGTVGLILSIPLFDRFLTRHAVEQARLELHDQEIVAEGLRQQMDVELLQAFENYSTAVKQVDVARTQKQFTHQSLAVFEERYKVNASTLVEVTQARSKHLEAAYDEVKAKYNLVAKGIAVEYYKGDIVNVMSLLKS